MIIDINFRKKIKFIENFPKEGVNFVDYSSIFNNKATFIELKRYICKLLDGAALIDYVVGIESRGFTFAAMISTIYNIPLVLVRKKGKLPNKVFSFTYDTEYSSDCVEIQRTDIKKDKTYLIVDDVLATGGTLNAVKQLIEDNKGIVNSAFVFIDCNLNDCKFNKNKLLKIMDVKQ